MKLYEFCDTSHHKGQLQAKDFIALGHRMIIPKASDSYHLPKADGTYDIPADIHTDSQWVNTFVRAREMGMISHGYHFVRFDRPLPLSGHDTIVKKNLEYYLRALAEVPAKYQDDLKQVGIIDMEQSSSQLTAAGLNKTIVSNMAIKIVDLWLTKFPKVIFYAGSWWTDEWLTAAASAYIASKTVCWEPEYITGALDPATSYTLSPSKVDYIPTPPMGFKKEWMTDPKIWKGKIFSWQYSAGGRIQKRDGTYYHSNFDMNVTALEKAKLQEFFGQDIAVDPPAPTPTPPNPVPEPTPTPTPEPTPVSLDTLMGQFVLVNSKLDAITKKLAI